MTTTDGRLLRARGQRDLRRSQLLEAARQVFAERGYLAARVSDVIEVAGVARGTFYSYFDSKQALFGAVLETVFQSLEDCVEGIRVGGGHASVMGQLRGNVERILRLVLGDAHLSNILRRAAVGVDAELDAQLAQFYDGLVALLERTVRLGMQSGLLRPVDPRLAAHCILGGAKEVTAHLQSLPESERPSLERLVDEIVAYHLRGLGSERLLASMEQP